MPPFLYYIKTEKLLNFELRLLNFRLSIFKTHVTNFRILEFFLRFSGFQILRFYFSFSYSQSLSHDFKADDACCDRDVQRVDVAWHRYQKMFVGTFQISLADSVFFRTHHYCDWNFKVGFPDVLTSFFGDRDDLDTTALQEVDSILNIFDPANIDSRQCARRCLHGVTIN